MMKLIIGGCCGRMGIALRDCAVRYGFEVTAGFDVASAPHLPFPVYDSPATCREKADVLIDFSRPQALEGLLEYALRTSTPAVMATTGYSDEQLESLEKAAKRIPVFRSANMSVGVNLLISLVRRCADALGNDFDIEIIEKHHNRKTDAPSGTALMLADAVNSALPSPRNLVYGRSPESGRREKDEIGIHSVRGGSIVGEHEVLFAGENEVISLEHSVSSREVFAVGALRAARFLVGCEPGMYDMNDLLGRL